MIVGDFNLCWRKNIFRIKLYTVIWTERHCWLLKLVELKSWSWEIASKFFLRPWISWSQHLLCCIIRSLSSKVICMCKTILLDQVLGLWLLEVVHDQNLLLEKKSYSRLERGVSTQGSNLYKLDWRDLVYFGLIWWRILLEKLRGQYLRCWWILLNMCLINCLIF